MDVLRVLIEQRETHIALLVIFRNLLPKEIINYINSFLKTSQKLEYTEFNTGIKKIEDEINSNISMGATCLLNILITVFVDKLMYTATVLMEHSRCRTITSREIQNAVRILIPFKFARIMISEAGRVITMYNAFLADGPDNKEETKAKRRFTMIKLERTKVERVMRNAVVDHGERLRVGKGAIVYFTAVLECLIKKIIQPSKEKKLIGNVYTETIINSCKYDNDLKRIYSELFI
jgi:histone H3/H4